MTTRTLPLNDVTQRYDTAVADVAGLRRTYVWAVDMYGEKHHRVAQAKSELALALLSLAVERGKKSISCSTLQARALSTDELQTLAEPALSGVYGLTEVQIRKALLPERRAERQAEKLAAEAEARRRRERLQRRLEA